jgi:predicted nucleic acid-binding protein
VAQVIDASVAVAWCVRTQATALSYAALATVSETGGHVPAQFWFEVLHSLERLQRRGGVSRTVVGEFVESLSELAITIHPAYEAPEMVLLHTLSRQWGLSIYDAAYLELASRLELPLATRDESLARAAHEAGVALFTA